MNGRFLMKAMKEKHYQLAGLIGFIIAGLIFVGVGIRFEDNLTILGSLVWIVSCLIWLIPVVRPPKE